MLKKLLFRQILRLLKYREHNHSKVKKPLFCQYYCCLVIVWYVTYRNLNLMKSDRRERDLNPYVVFIKVSELKGTKHTAQ